MSGLPPKRKALSKKIRFEVFKRDSFTCQYCGGKAPDVLLHVDHITPVSKGGGNDMLNLTTACEGCNGGKSNRELSDASVVEKQRAQLEALQERREQINQMFDWQKGLADVEGHTIEKLAEYWVGLSRRELTAGEINIFKKLVKEFTLEEIIKAMDVAADQYLHWRGESATRSSCSYAVKKIGGICHLRKQGGDRPECMRVYYVRGILRKRFPDTLNEQRAMILLRECLEAAVSMDEVERAAKVARSWSHFADTVETMLAEVVE